MASIDALELCPLLERAEKALSEDRDHMVATADDMPWLIAQLACWPTRVDEQCTTNMRFLMSSAAATLLASLPTRKAPVDDEVERALEAFNGGMVKVPYAPNPRGFVMKYQPKIAMRAAIAALSEGNMSSLPYGGEG